MFLATQRLLLVNTPLHVIQARLQSDEFHASIDTPRGALSVHFPSEWPGEDYLPLLPLHVAALQRDPHAEPWGGTLILKDQHVAIGQMGFKGGPDANGTAELGYGLNRSAWNQGYATEMLRALIAWGLQQPGVRRITAKTAVSNPASGRVLQKAGLRPVGNEIDPEDGPLTLWELPTGEGGQLRA